MAAPRSAPVDHMDQRVKLKVAFQEGGVADLLKRQQAKEERKADFLNDLLTFKIKGNEDGEGRAGEEKEITFQATRRFCSREYLQLRINASARPCILDFFFDSDGTPFSVEDLILKAQPHPAFYVVVPERLIEPYDVLTFTNYDGETAILLQNVPRYCDDRSVEVDAVTLREWIVFAILESDETLLPFEEAIESCRLRIKELQREVKGVDSRVFYDANNNKIEGVWADNERLLLFNVLSDERIGEEDSLQRLIAEQETHRKKRKDRISLRLEKQQDTASGADEGQESVCCWRLWVEGMDDARAIENSIIERLDWAGIRLASHSADFLLPPWAGRQVVPVGISSLHADYSGLEVRIASTRLARVPHGAGFFRTLDRQSSSIAADRFGLFYGGFAKGKRAGSGFEVNDAGVFTGNYQSGLRRGHGRLDLADGTSITGSFNVSQLRPSSSDSDSFINPYLEGEPHGDNIDILFGDGGRYKGQMTNGTITGVGEYQSAFGDVLRGRFVNGVLQGEDCVVIERSGDSLSGKFEHGELNGVGKYESASDGDCYEGDFLFGLPHGRGEMTHRGWGRYRGFYTWGMKSGKGEFDYGVDDNGIGDDDIFIHHYRGFMVADRIASGGLLMSGSENIPRSISRRVPSVAEPLDVISDHLRRQQQQRRRDKEKFTYMEHNIRRDITIKKHKIFRQQRHLIKKTMYDADKEGSVPMSAITARLKARQDRINFIAERVVTVPIPGYNEEVIAEKYEHVQRTLDHIQPEDAVAERTNLAEGMQMLRVVLSDTEEMAERQRFLKYDRIWKRVEAAFVGLKLNS